MTVLSVQYIHGFLIFVLGGLCLSLAFFTSPSTPKGVKRLLSLCPLLFLYFLEEKLSGVYFAYPVDIAMALLMIVVILLLIDLVNTVNILRGEPLANWNIERKDIYTD